MWRPRPLEEAAPTLCTLRTTSLAVPHPPQRLVPGLTGEKGGGLPCRPAAGSAPSVASGNAGLPAAAPLGQQLAGNASGGPAGRVSPRQ